MYVDDDNLPVEIKVDLAAAGAFEVHFSDYGKDVSIEAPPADQVSDLRPRRQLTDPRLRTYCCRATQ